MPHPLVSKTIINFFLKEWLLTVSGLGLIVTSIFTKKIPAYSTREMEILFVLFTLFIATNGLLHSGFITKITNSLEQGKMVPLKLILATWVLSMFVTNDIALLVIVQVTLLLNIERKDILIIFEALAANAGSELSPLGNPQNFFIYWFYKITLIEFVKTILPFSLTFLILLIAVSFFIKTKNNLSTLKRKKRVKKTAIIYLIFLITIFMTVLHLIPVISAGLIIIFAALFDKKAFKTDYALLLSFFFLFGFADNIKNLLEPAIIHSKHIFLASALSSQIISNVPATLLFAKLTSNWKALLWGTNAGGFGSLFGSFANIIAYKIYITHKKSTSKVLFTIKFFVIGYTAFILALALYFLKF
jgi:Na+/H+ antiporter NhaD/arsenite permease-like protein